MRAQSCCSDDVTSICFLLFADAMLNEDKKIFEALGNEDPGMESFEQLFSRMTYMKGKIWDVNIKGGGGEECALIGKERKKEFNALHVLLA